MHPRQPRKMTPNAEVTQSRCCDLGDFVVDRKMALDEFLKGEEMRGNEVWGPQDKTFVYYLYRSRFSVSLSIYMTRLPVSL